MGVVYFFGESIFDDCLCLCTVGLVGRQVVGPEDQAKLVDLDVVDGQDDPTCLLDYAQTRLLLAGIGFDLTEAVPK